MSSKRLILASGTQGETFSIVLPEGATTGQRHVGRRMSFAGVTHRIERHYRRYRKDGTYNHWMEKWLKKVMVEYTCPDCGGRRLKRQRFLVTIGGKDIHELGDMSFEALIDFLQDIPIPPRKREAGRQVVSESVRR